MRHHLLVEAGADSTACTVGNRSSATHLAAENGPLEVVRMLVRLAADVNALNAAGTTARYQVLRWLVKALYQAAAGATSK